MKKKWIVLIAVLAVVGLIAGLFVGTYNGLVSAEENINGKTAEIQTQLQRRADLIPNFVNTVKGYSDYEQSTLQAVTEARSAVAEAATPAQQAEAGEQLDSAIDIWVNAITEAYPDLEASDQYVALQDELAGTENRIATARRDYNEAVQSYNTSIRRFPKSLIAAMFGFEKAEFFEADEDAKDNPVVLFD